MDLNLGVKDIIDILLVAGILYQIYRLLKGTVAINIFVGILSFVLFWFLVTSIFKMELLGAILDKVISLGGVFLIVIFQDEIRRFFFSIGTRNRWRILKGLERFFSNKKESSSDYMKVVKACQRMSKTKTGALIVIERRSSLEPYTQTGEHINAEINSRLIENIFFKNSPLHDGAMIISGNAILAAGCILPVSHNREIPRHLGLRHRSALGISEKSDAIAIIVSEETGKMSVAHNGILKRHVSAEDLENILSDD